VGVVIPLEDKVQEPGITGLLALVAADMDRVNQTILSKAISDVSTIPEVANHLISSGGKRLRPMLTLATAGLCGYKGAGHVKLAASVEFMHTATLLHDDVVDESDMRRGKLAARMLWGNETSVLVGDFLLGQAFKMMVEVGSLPCLDVLSTAATVIAEGEVMQLAVAKDTEASEDDYLAVIRAKTAALFGAAAELGPLLAKRPKPEVAACRGYGFNLGIAFLVVNGVIGAGIFALPATLALQFGSFSPWLFPLFGLLVLASPEAQRFAADMGTDFLDRIGELTAAALTRLLPS